MFSSNPIEINKSSLVSLKAEILRKQQELKSNKTFNKPVPKPIVTKQKKKQGNERQSVIIEDEDDRELLARSKQILESKTKLYNMLSKDPSNFTERERELSKRTLVQFDRKEFVPHAIESDEENHSGEEYNAKNADEEWVEYVDALGRTRKCLRKDLDYMKRKDRDLSESIEGSGRLREEPQKFVKEDVKENKDNETIITDLSEENELLSSDMRREILRHEWEKQEQELLNKKNIHYQDLLFQEARSHGVGYYAFSQDEEERAKQQENLKKLRTETTEKQKVTAELKELREKQLAARLKAARNRKRARMGLPPEEDEPEKPVEIKTESEQEKRERMEKELEEKRKQEERDRFVRPWDIGKEILKKHHEYSQEEWVHKKRQERPVDFAPPSSYNRDKKSDEETNDKSLYFSSNKKKQIKTKRINPYYRKQSEQNEAKLATKSKSDDRKSGKYDEEEDSDDSSKEDSHFNSRSIDPEPETSKIDFVFQKEINFEFVNDTKTDEEIKFDFKHPETSKSSESESINFNFTKLDQRNHSESDINFTFKRPSSDQNDAVKKLKTSKYISPFNVPTSSDYPSYDMGLTLPVRQETTEENTDDPPGYFVESPERVEENRRNDRLEEPAVPKIDPTAIEESVVAGLKYLREQVEKKSKKNRDEDFIS